MIAKELDLLFPIFTRLQRHIAKTALSREGVEIVTQPLPMEITLRTFIRSFFYPH